MGASLVYRLDWQVERETMSEIFYIQCMLQRRTRKDETLILLTWLPERYAVPHKILKLKNDKDQWEDSWHVLEVYKSSRAPASIVEGNERNYKYQREASDV